MKLDGGSYNHGLFFPLSQMRANKSIQMKIQQERHFREDTTHWTISECAIFFCVCKTMGVQRVMFWGKFKKDILLLASEGGFRVSGSLKGITCQAHSCVLSLFTPFEELGLKLNFSATEINSWYLSARLANLTILYPNPISVLLNVRLRP